MKLDDAYANAAHIEGADDFPPRWSSQAAAYRDITGAQVDLPYGPEARHRFDLILPEGPPKGVLVFVHGGYWLRFDKSYWSHFATAAVARGYAAALPSYELAPRVRISDITAQIAAAVCQIAEMVAGPVLLAGHSAGGHLVARMVCEDVLPEAVAARITRVVPISPVSDLRPLMQTSMNEDLKLDAEECARESPALLTPRAGVAVTVVVGRDERPVFLDQAQWLAQAWGCDLVIAGGKHHFDVIDAFADPDSDLSRMLFE